MTLELGETAVVSGALYTVRRMADDGARALVKDPRQAPFTKIYEFRILIHCMHRAFLRVSARSAVSCM